MAHSRLHLDSAFRPLPVTNHSKEEIDVVSLLARAMEGVFLLLQTDRWPLRALFAMAKESNQTINKKIKTLKTNEKVCLKSIVLHMC